MKQISGKSLLICLAISLLIMLHQAGCGSGNDGARNSFQIKLVDSDPSKVQNILSSSTQKLLTSSALSIATGPSVISDFNCFAVNITGEGISPGGALTGGCQSPNNFKGVGAGILSTPTPRGQSISLDLPSGTARRIDVYGMYPSPPECGGSGGQSISSYFVGSKTVDMLQSASITIPVAYAGGSEDILCSGGQSVPLPMIIANGLNESGQLTSNGANCFSNIGAPPTGSTLPSGPSNVFPDTNYLSEDGNTTISECSYLSAGNRSALQYAFDTSSVGNLNAFQGLKVIWKGQGGIYNTCSTNANPAYSSGGVTVWIYRNNIGSWLQIGAPTTGTQGLLNAASGIFPTAADFPTGPSNYIFVRVVGSPVSAANDCSQIRTDFISVQLLP